MISINRINQPIFIVGCGRSGTTILYNLLCGHPDLAWFSNYSDRWPKHPQAALLSWMYRIDMLRQLNIKRMPIPSEGYRLWDYCKPVLDSPSDPPLTEKDVLPKDIDQIKNMINHLLKYQAKSRFINKNTRNTRRIRFLNTIFKDALFIHIMRDPRASVSSFLNVDFWPNLKIWCCDKITPNEWIAKGRNPIELAAQLWVAEVQRVLDDKIDIPKEQYMEIHYEDLMENPMDIILKILSFTRLDWNNQFDKFIKTFSLKNMNYKFKSQFNDDQLRIIQRTVNPLAKNLGYAMNIK